MPTITFVPDPNDFMNPERGPFIRQYIKASEGNYWYIRANYESTLVKGTVVLSDFRESNISQAKLDEVQTQLDFIRSAGLKVILNFQYNEGGDDASYTWIQTHVSQLTPLLQNNVDIIAAMHMGFIGYWGEGHNSSNGLDNTADRKNILNLLGAALPSDRMILIRCPWWKYDILGHSVDHHVNQAFTGTKMARYGHQNTGWLGPDQGYPQGTYPHEEPTQQWIDTMFAESQYLACDLEHSLVTEYSNCVNAVQWAKDVHADFVNKLWMPAVWDILEAEGCKDEILKNIGYRFVLTSATLPDEVVGGSQLDFHLELTNEGYASMYNERPVFLVLENGPSRYDFRLCDLDPRWWFPGDHSLDASVNISEGMPNGEYAVSLWMPDYYENLRGDSRYSIRTANVGIWDALKGTNYLGQITIEGECT